MDRSQGDDSLIAAYIQAALAMKPAPLQHLQQAAQRLRQTCCHSTQSLPTGTSKRSCVTITPSHRSSYTCAVINKHVLDEIDQLFSLCNDLQRRSYVLMWLLYQSKVLIEFDWVRGAVRVTKRGGACVQIRSACGMSRGYSIRPAAGS